MADMNAKRNATKARTSEAEVDAILESQADDDSAWTKPIKVRKLKLDSLSIPADLAARAAFLARMHREKKVEDWLRRIIKERVEMEEVAFVETKREMATRNGA
jgi:hypothetical protein